MSSVDNRVSTALKDFNKNLNKRAQPISKKVFIYIFFFFMKEPAQLWGPRLLTRPIEIKYFLANRLFSKKKILFIL